jgi:hypothetical protein
MRRGNSIFINTFLDLPQHVSAGHCHHQGVMVCSEATQAFCIVDLYGLRPVQSGQLSRDVTKRVQWIRFLQEPNPLYTPGKDEKYTEMDRNAF